MTRGRRPRMPMLDSRRYWRIYTRKNGWQATRFEDACRPCEALDAILFAAGWPGLEGQV